MTPKEDPTSLGSLLLSMGAITPSQLEIAVTQQALMDKEMLLGKLLVANKAIDNETLQEALKTQERLRQNQLKLLW